MKNKNLLYYQKKITPLLSKYGVRKAAFFGSLVEGKLTGKSDIDILVEPSDDMSLLTFVGLKQDIEDKIKRNIDLVSYNRLSPYLKDNIISQQKVIYEKRS